MRTLGCGKTIYTLVARISRVTFREDDLQGDIQATPFRKLVEMSAVPFMLNQWMT
jgi:hypothetical protein